MFNILPLLFIFSFSQTQSFDKNYNRPNQKYPMIEHGISTQYLSETNFNSSLSFGGKNCIKNTDCFNCSLSSCEWDSSLKKCFRTKNHQSIGRLFDIS